MGKSIGYIVGGVLALGAVILFSRLTFLTYEREIHDIFGLFTDIILTSIVWLMAYLNARKALGDEKNFWRYLIIASLMFMIGAIHIIKLIRGDPAL